MVFLGQECRSGWLGGSASGSLISVVERFHRVAAPLPQWLTWLATCSWLLAQGCNPCPPGLSMGLLGHPHGLGLAPSPAQTIPATKMEASCLQRPGLRSHTSILCCRKKDPFQGPKLGSCLTLRSELSEETHVLTKQETLLGKGTRVENSRVREPRRTALPRGSQCWVLW